MRKVGIILGLVVFALPQALLAGTAGFLDSEIWFSEAKFYAGNEVRVYAGIVNSSDDDISGTVQFFDNGDLLGAQDFRLEKGGNFTRTWTDWVPSVGAHKISAKIINPENFEGDEAALDSVEASTVDIFISADPEEVKRIEEEREQARKAEEERLAQEHPGDQVAREHGEGVESQDNDGGGGVLDVGVVGDIKDSKIAQSVGPATTKVVDGASNTDQRIKDVLDVAVEKLKDKRVEVRQEKEGLPEGESGAFLNIYIFMLSVLILIFAVRVLVYLILLYVGYRIVKWLIRRWRDRHY